MQIERLNLVLTAVNLGILLLACSSRIPPAAAQESAGSVDGAGLLLMGEGQGTYATLQGEGTSTSLKLTTKDGRQREIVP